MRKDRTYVCEDCGQETTRARASIDPKVCFDCGIERAASAARQMYAKRGPAYDRYQRNRPFRKTAEPTDPGG